MYAKHMQNMSKWLTWQDTYVWRTEHFYMRWHQTKTHTFLPVMEINLCPPFDYTKPFFVWRRNSFVSVTALPLRRFFFITQQLVKVLYWWSLRIWKPATTYLPFRPADDVRTLKTNEKFTFNRTQDFQIFYVTRNPNLMIWYLIHVDDHLSH